MRLRGHTCHYCRTIDEAHHGRHRRIAEGLRDVYESAGEPDWTIIPSEPEERGRAKEYGANSAGYEDGDRDNAAENTPSSKRERKNAKCLARAASRARVISQDEILHVDSVIHSADGVSSGESDAPCNVEEMEEIERHLKYNAHVYNSQRRDLKKFARLPDVDVDFDAEMDCILEALRVTELLKCNTRNRGLQGKELKTFLAHVEELKKMIVDDLVAVKKDVFEVRMRRAGYLRYTNKTAHSIVEERYTDKDWKTGEKVSSNGSSSSELASNPEELESAYRYVQDNGRMPPTLSNTFSSRSSDQATDVLPSTAKHDPDHRHLAKIHTRINGDDGLGQNVIEPYHAPLLPLSADVTSTKRAVQLRVVKNVSMPAASPQGSSTQAKSGNADDEAWQTVLHGKKQLKPTVKPAWGMTASGRPITVPSRPVNPWGPDSCEIPDLRLFPSPAVQPTPGATKANADGPEGFIDDDPTTGHPVVSQKKAKKYEREARRKAKKAVELATVVVESQAPAAPDTVAFQDPTSAVKPSNRFDSPVALPSDAVLIETTVEVVTTHIDDIADLEPSVGLANIAPPEPLAVTNSSKHMHWLKFKRQFIVDQLTDPCLTLWPGCSHGTSCAFEAHGVVDCPFHQPRESIGVHSIPLY